MKVLLQKSGKVLVVYMLVSGSQCQGKESACRSIRRLIGWKIQDTTERLGAAVENVTLVIRHLNAELPAFLCAHACPSTIDSAGSSRP